MTTQRHLLLFLYKLIPLLQLIILNNTIVDGSYDCEFHFEVSVPPIVLLLLIVFVVVNNPFNHFSSLKKTDKQEF
jgi:hypothetical protein